MVVKRHTKKYMEREKEGFNRVEDNKFTKQEHAAYNRRDRNFIKGIMIKENSSKDAAIKRFKEYIVGTIKNRKLFRKRVSESIRRYGKWKGDSP